MKLHQSFVKVDQALRTRYLSLLFQPKISRPIFFYHYLLFY
ncbi:conserved protein of unknown function [Listeria monocytogenes]|nr:conserved protein of unknown function [Listeria monocytogenes]